MWWFAFIRLVGYCSLSSDGSSKKIFMYLYANSFIPDDLLSVCSYGCLLLAIIQIDLLKIV